MENFTKNYYIGLDIGSNSIGWAVTDDDYSLLNYKGKSMWGVRLVDEAKTAVERRTFRSNRRRLARRKDRIKLLNELFSPFINEVDPEFFMRLQESNLNTVDRMWENNHIIFGKNGRSDREFYIDNPTAYHLRRRVMSGEETDIRAIYLAIHHIIKYRGHFLLEGQEPDVEKMKNAEDNFIRLDNTVRDLFEDVDIKLNKYPEIEDTLLSNSIGKRDKKKKLFSLLFGEQKFSSEEKAQRDSIISAIFGDKVTLSKLYINAEYAEAETANFEFSSSVYEDSIDGELRLIVGDDYALIDALKAIYDWMIFRKLLKDYDYISDSMIAKYDKHRDDLTKLKTLLREYYSREDYIRIFGKAKETEKNYSNYIGSVQVHNEKYALKKVNAEELYKTVKKVLEKKKDTLSENELYRYIMTEISERNFLPKQLSTDNSVIPYQFNLIELREIINRYDIFKTLNGGITFGEKLEKLLTFRVPYYVGPLNIDRAFDSTEKGFAWAVRNDSAGNRQKITPWNFDNIIDRAESANRFIRRMTNKCTYLKDCDVIPAKSILYSDFMLLNEINNIKINGYPIGSELKQKMIKDIFMSTDPIYKTVTVAKIKEWLIYNNQMSKADINKIEITGIDDKIKANLNTRKQFSYILGSSQAVDDNLQMIEDIVRWHTIFEEKNMVISKIKAEYPGRLTEDQIKKIKQLNFSGWSRLSSELLTEIKAYDHEVLDGECYSIMDLLRMTNMNFMEILHSEKYRFMDEINAFNGDMSLQKLTYADVDELYCSPKVKRVIWQSIKVVGELVKIMGCPPTKIFIEMARDLNEDNKKVAKKSRKEQLLELYENCGNLVDEELRDSLQNMPEERLKKEQLFLYYLQLGRSVYSGKPIDINRLLNEDNVYDIDHIRPRAIVKDDSVLNNKVLVLREENSHKSDVYPLPIEFRTPETKALWKSLLDNKLMTEEKYSRLIRTNELSDTELASFIERQIVDTRQSTKEVAKLFGRLYGEETDIVYVKAGLTSEFRYKYHLVKVRELNDLHHAKDAYLNIVVGDIYDTVFTRNPLRYVQSHPRSEKSRKPSYNFEKMFDWEIRGKENKLIWNGKDGTSVVKIKNIYGQNNILVTRMELEQKGSFYNMNLSPKGVDLAPLTENVDNPLSDTTKYGGYNSVRIAYYYLVKHIEKKKEKYTIEGVPVYMRDRIKNKADLAQYAIKQGLVNPEIIIAKLKINTLLNFEGTSIYLTGKSGDSLLIEKAAQIFIDEELMEPLKHILKFVENMKAAERMKKQLYYSKYDGFKANHLISLYDTFANKLSKGIFTGVPTLGSYAKTFIEKRDKFISLCIEDQAILLSEMIHFMQANNLSSNLEKIDGVSNAGKTSIRKNVTDKRIDILYPSVTGLYLTKIHNVTRQ